MVDVLEREPHDWVAYAEHTRGRLVGDHMQRGNTVPVPTWMGEYSFNGVNLVPIVGPDGRFGDLTEVEILGLAWFAFDNNNTPPHVVRGLMNDARGILATVLHDELQGQRTENGVVRGCPVVLSALRTGDMSALSANLQSQMQAVALKTIDLWKAAGLLAQLTVGSTFNPDQPAGLNIVLVPAASGLPPQFATQGPIQPAAFNLPGGRMLAQTTLLLPATTQSRLVFTGSGAIYSSAFGLQVTAPPAPAQNASQVVLRIRTGGDDLRGGNDNVFASVRIAGRWRNEVMLNGGTRSADNTPHDAMLPLGPAPLAQIEAIRLPTTFGGGMGGGNWNMDSIQIDWRGLGGVGGPLATRGFKRFTGDDRELLIEFR